MEPEVKKYFWKIIYTISWGFLWMFASAMIGFYYGLGLIDNQISWINLTFYIVTLLGFLFLLRYYYRMWK